MSYAKPIFKRSKENATKFLKMTKMMRWACGDLLSCSGMVIRGNQNDVRERTQEEKSTYEYT